MDNDLPINKFKTLYDYYIIDIKGFFTIHRKRVLFMGLEHSFINYVEVEFYNELFDALQDFISNHSDRLNIRLNIVEEIVEIELSDIVIPGSIIAFDVLIETYIEVSDTNKRIVDERKIGEQWFILECLTDMESNFKNLK